LSAPDLQESLVEYDRHYDVTYNRKEKVTLLTS